MTNKMFENDEEIMNQQDKEAFYEWLDNNPSDEGDMDKPEDWLTEALRM